MQGTITLSEVAGGAGINCPCEYKDGSLWFALSKGSTPKEYKKVK